MMRSLIFYRNPRTQVTAIIVGGIGSYSFRKHPEIFLSAGGDSKHVLSNTLLALAIEVRALPTPAALLPPAATPGAPAALFSA